LGLVAALLVSASVATASRSARPALRLARGSNGLVVYGSGFYANEAVRVTVVTTSMHARVVRTRPVGTFAARFGDTFVDPCNAMSVRAVGRRGDRALLKIPPRACSPA
jgi:hypothetical protein